MNVTSKEHNMTRNAINARIAELTSKMGGRLFTTKYGAECWGRDLATLTEAERVELHNLRLAARRA